jgi:hypothetical protein
MFASPQRDSDLELPHVGLHAFRRAPTNPRSAAAVFAALGTVIGPSTWHAGGAQTNRHPRPIPETRPICEGRYTLVTSR